MKEIIEDIQNLMKEGAFRDEQHIRFSLVGRTCKALGWNIWNPAEFYTEYPVKKYPVQNINAELRGKVDIALISTEKLSEIADVFIEVKTPYKLQTERQAGEDQLQSYNFWDKSAISILTDGITWLFYLPSAGGSFGDKLFCEFNLLSDDIDDICNMVNSFLRRDNFSQTAIQTAEEMLEEKRMIILIGKVKKQAEDIAVNLGDSQFIVAQKLIKNQHKKECPLSEIQRLWVKAKYISEPVNVISEPTQVHKRVMPSPKQDNLPREIQTNSLNNYLFTKPILVKINGNESINVSNWKQVKRAVYNFLIEKVPDIKLPKPYDISHNPEIYRYPISLVKGYYTESNLSSNAIVDHCKRAMKFAGFDPDTDLIISVIQIK